ncbi:hypothetical protein HYC85_027273 [Camellia sinensis]|uniref:Biogenesis of lysosome-related organelles complex 1 subunit 7 n=1 Tax=Camellia sinensis TaxID=4442 RepID=A0A7J7G9W0_CAMSI|nr:hypothetical protein HYC85_027273 [Camellia sinensis]
MLLVGILVLWNLMRPCTVEETEDTSNGLGPYEIVDANEFLQNSPLNDDDVVVPEVSVSEISWDISVENPQVHVIEGTGLSNAVFESHTSIPNIVTETQEIAQQRSQLLETEYRNKILDYLFEIKAFLNQSLTELTNNETLSLQHQVQAVAPLVLQQYSSDTIQKMLSDVSLAISSLRNRKTRDQIMILNSKRFLDRLVSTLEEKKHHQVKLNEGLKDLSAKRMELQNSLTSLWPKQPLVSGAAIGLEGQHKHPLYLLNLVDMPICWVHKLPLIFLTLTPLKLDLLPTEARISGKEYKERVVNNLKILIVHYSVVPEGCLL